MHISAEAWIEWVHAEIGRVDTARLPIADAHGRTLAQAVRAAHDLPLWDNSAMDGYAIRAEDTAGASVEAPATLIVTGAVRAGSSDDARIVPGTAVRIMTGAPVPSDANTVAPVELTVAGASPHSGVHPEAWDRTSIRLEDPVSEGANIRRRGEDVRAGSTIALAGDLLTGARLSALAAAGVREVAVSEVPRVAVLVTGTELTDGASPLRRGEIVESNSLLISGLLRECGIPPFEVRRCGDTTAEVRAAFDDLGERCDMIISTGGIGPGSHDVVRIVAKAETGVRATRVAMRPGQPQCAGRLASGAWLFGLPGNPVSAAVSFELFVRPALLALQGRTHTQRRRIPGVAAVGWRGARERLQVLPVTLDDPQVPRDGVPAPLPCRPAVNPRGVSHAVGGHGAVQAYALVGPDRGDIEAGESVELLLVTP